MEDVLGGWTDAGRFAAFLNDWQAILERRVEQAVGELAAVEGVRGLVLAGSLGRNAAWPLSDIDILPVYDAARMEAAAAEVERRRLPLLEQWIAEGWWTGLDIGRLCFTVDEAIHMTSSSNQGIPAILDDDRWYYSIDKGFQGRAVYDPDGVAARLAAWITEHRFNREVIQFRLGRLRREIREGLGVVRESASAGDTLAGTRALRRSVILLMTYRLERWGERDNSQGRLGTRFERIAADHGCSDLATELNSIADLDDGSVARRMAIAPGWVHERHERSWAARRHINEPVTRLLDARDSLRVCALYEMRRQLTPPYAGWLAIAPTREELRARADRLTALITE